MTTNYILGWLVSMDKSATMSLNFDGGTIADFIFHSVSCSISWTPLALLFLYFVIKDHRRNLWMAFAIVAGLAVTITLCDQASSGIIKPLVMRPRPSHTDGVSCFLHYVNNYHGGRYGFVSSHAANAVGSVVFTSLMVRRRWFTVIGAVYAFIVCYSRVYLGVHYVGDVVCGAALGAMLGTLVGLTYLPLMHLIGMAVLVVRRRFA